VISQFSFTSASLTFSRDILADEDSFSWVSVGLIESFNGDFGKPEVYLKESQTGLTLPCLTIHSFELSFPLLIKGSLSSG
jgi:hypothetical protein